jgi:hypothetical protein
MSVSSSSKLWKFITAASASLALVLSGLMASPASASPAALDPVLKVTVLNDYNCGIRVVGSIPNGFDPGTVQLEINGADSGILATLVDPTVDTAIDITIPMTNAASSLQGNINVASIVVAGPDTTNMCAEATVKLKYRANGSTVLTAQETVTPRFVATDSRAWVMPVLNKACTVRVFATTAVFTDGNLYKVVVSAGIGGWDIFFKNVDPNHPLDVEINMGDVESVQTNPRTQSVLVWGDPFNCEQAGIQVGTYVNGGSQSAELTSISAGIATECQPGTYGTIRELWDGGPIFHICLNAPAGYIVPQANILYVPEPCPAGFYTATEGATNCTPASVGYYVPTSAAGYQTPCPLGTFTSVTGSSWCTLAPLGTYVDVTGATAFTQCPAAYSTYLLGARSIYECHKLTFQTAKAIRFPTKLKLGKKLETAARTDAGLPLEVSVSGPCTVTTKNIKVKLNGQKVTQPRFVFTAGKKAGKCTVTLTSTGDNTYKSFTKIRSFKVTK